MRDTAIRNTHPTVVSINAEIDATDQQGNTVILDEAKIAAEITKLHAAHAATQYRRDRIYPPIGDQLDALWHMIDNGEPLDKTSSFYTMIKMVKDTYPKTS